MSTHLKKYGLHGQFNDFLNGQSSSMLGRVTSVHRTSYDVMTESGEITCEITGNRLKDKDPYQKPIVGDWVLVEMGEGGNANIIREILPRNTVLERRKVNASDKEEIQLIATNVDVAVIVQALDQDFSLARIQRTLTQLSGTGIRPMVVLNKLDLVSDIDQVKKEIHQLDADLPVVFTSLETGHGLSDLEQLFESGETIVFIGSSGVGKSSIINTMLDEERQQKTGEISECSGKGKHTTTARKLFLLDNGVSVIDTPGTREFGVTADLSALDDVFRTIDELATNCKFRDCRHQSEPGCAVKDAVSTGIIDEEVLKSYQKLREDLKN